MAQCGSGGNDPHGSGSAAGAEDWSPQAALPSFLRGRPALPRHRVSPAVSDASSGPVKVHFSCQENSMKRPNSKMN